VPVVQQPTPTPLPRLAAWHSGRK